ncbi:hypothetical protein FPZ49_34130 [Paenibacillus cremeus]|uniref:Uncharacterized protein n=1 Tax=Paenibacillus cremeus TaxID=2163881 RepID=A0A559JGJ1_9BACL|nr:hypothetical protein FPZ49_34130 [Paenibacillus cremeus]
MLSSFVGHLFAMGQQLGLHCCRNPSCLLVGKNAYVCVAEQQRAPSKSKKNEERLFRNLANRAVFFAIVPRMKIGDQGEKWENLRLENEEWIKIKNGFIMYFCNSRPINIVWFGK